MNQEDTERWLHWATLLHEIGLVIAHNQYHKHGAYSVAYSDLPGFSLGDQRFLSVLVRCHRRKFRQSVIDVLPDSWRDKAIKLCTLLRLAVLVHRNRSHSAGPAILASARQNSIRLAFPKGWLKNHPLTQTDLDIEKKYLKSVGLKLEYG